MKDPKDNKDDSGSTDNNDNADNMGENLGELSEFEKLKKARDGIIAPVSDIRAKYEYEKECLKKKKETDANRTLLRIMDSVQGDVVKMVTAWNESKVLCCHAMPEEYAGAVKKPHDGVACFFLNKNESARNQRKACARMWGRAVLRELYMGESSKSDGYEFVEFSQANDEKNDFVESFIETVLTAK